MERTLILVKPDAFARNLTGEIIARFERKGLRLVALQQMTMTRELAAQHYAEHEGKPFYEELVEFITSGPLVAMVLEGEQAVVAARQVIGATNPLEATTGSIRGDYAIEVGQNMVHGSDAPRVGGPRGGAVLPGPRPDPRLALAAAARDPDSARGDVRGACRATSRSSSRGRRTRSRSRTPIGRRRPSPPAHPMRSCSASTRSSRSAAGSTASLGIAPTRGETLAALAGRQHAVISGVCLIEAGRTRTLAPTTLVTIRPLDAAAIDRYLDTGEWRDRAGAYAIQGRGALLVRAIEGDYLNVVGLPVAALVELVPALFGA